MNPIHTTQEAIAEEMKAAAEGSKEYQQALADYETCVEKQLRIENALKQLADEEVALHEEKEQLTTNFGEQDPLADTNRLEAINNRLIAINESRELLNKRMVHNGNITRLKEDTQKQVKTALLNVLPEIQKRYQAELDRQVNDLIGSIEIYRGALYSFFNCKTKDKKHKVYIGSLNSARLAIKDIHKLEQLSDDMRIG